MRRVRLLHWNAKEAAAIVGALQQAGFDVEYDERVDSSNMREWRVNPPSVYLIDLSRMPSRGREVAIALRQSPKTCHVPLVFCEGAAEKVKLIREILPDAAYCSAADVVKSLRAVKPVMAPAKPLDMMNRYGARTTAQKLGIK